MVFEAVALIGKHNSEHINHSVEELLRLYKVSLYFVRFLTPV